jgi:hypothetical protein
MSSRDLSYDHRSFMVETNGLTAEQVGALILLMSFYQWQGSLPDDDEQLAMIARDYGLKRWRRVLRPALERFFTSKEDGSLGISLVDRWNADRARPYTLDVPPATWQRLRHAVFHRDSFTCGYCGISGLDEPHCDHVIPRSQGGMSVLENLITSCRVCNISKGGKRLEEWRQ